MGNASVAIKYDQDEILVENRLFWVPKRRNFFADGQNSQLDVVYIEFQNASIFMIPFAKQSFMSLVTRKIKSTGIGGRETSKFEEWIFFIGKCPKVAPNYMERERCTCTLG